MPRAPKYLSFDISSFGDAGPDNDANIYGGVVKGAVLEGGYVVAQAPYQFTSNFYNTNQLNCPITLANNGIDVPTYIVGKYRYPMVKDNTISNAGHASPVNAGTYYYDFYAWNKCSETLRRLTNNTGDLAIYSVTGMLDVADSHSGCCSSQSSDKTWVITPLIPGEVSQTLTVRVKVSYNSNDWYWQTWIDGTSVQSGSDSGESSHSWSGNRTKNSIVFSINVSYNGEDYYDGWFNNIDGRWAYAVSIDMAASTRTVTMDQNDIIGFTTSGGTMKIPAATMGL